MPFMKLKQSHAFYLLFYYCKWVVNLIKCLRPFSTTLNISGSLHYVILLNFLLLFFFILKNFLLVALEDGLV